MSHRDGRVTLSAWVDPVLRDYARMYAKMEGMEFSRWVSRAIQRAIANESSARALKDATYLPPFGPSDGEAREADRIRCEEKKP